MFKTNLMIGSLILSLFVSAQTLGWNLFESKPGPKPPPGSNRTYHK